MSWLPLHTGTREQLVHLSCVDTQRRRRLDAKCRRLLLNPRIVAQDAFRPRVNPIRLFLPAAGLDRARSSRRADQLCIILALVPTIGIWPPRSGFEMQDLRFDRAPARRLAGLELERDGPRQHRAFGKLPGALGIQADLGRSRNAEKPLGCRSIGPELGIDLVWQEPGAGVPSRTEAKRPDSLNRRGKFRCASRAE